MGSAAYEDKADELFGNTIDDSLMSSKIDADSGSAVNDDEGEKEGRGGVEGDIMGNGRGVVY